MNWPPVKSWTSIKPINGFSYFVAFNYGGKDYSRWVLLVSVLDGNTRLRLSLHEITESANWIEGWPVIDRTKKNIQKGANNLLVLKDEFEIKGICLHPSDDSGFQIPTKSIKIREWR